MPSVGAGFATRPSHQQQKNRKLCFVQRYRFRESKGDHLAACHQPSLRHIVSRSDTDFC